jgi:Xaa-Pro aminopeptidase
MNRATTSGRQREVQQLLERNDLDAVLISSRENMLWATGTWVPLSPVSLLVVLADSAVAIVPDVGGVWREAPPINVDVMFYDSPGIEGFGGLPEVRARLQRLSLRGRIGVEHRQLAAGFTSVLSGAALVPVDHDLDVLRARKTLFELDRLFESAAYLDKSFQVICDIMRPGVTEYELYCAARESLESSSGLELVMEACIGSGPRASDPACRPTSREIAAGELVLVDLFPRLPGYHADATRMFVCGVLPDSASRHLGIVRCALDVAAETIRPGARAADVDRAVRSVLGEWGFPLVHHAGHGVGVFQHEPPFLVPDSEWILEEGMVLAVEPGIYDASWGGIRLESEYLVREDGAVRLDKFPLDVTPCR